MFLVNLINDVTQILLAPLIFLSSPEFFFFFTFFIVLNIFNRELTTFLRVIVLMLLLFIISVYLVYLGLDFFAGFLLVFELPVMLIASIFYFHKHGIKFDNLYTFNKWLRSEIFVTTPIMVIFFVNLYNTTTSLLGNSFFYKNIESSFIYNIYDYAYVSFRNDFLIWFITLYIEQPQIVIYIGTMIFLVSYVIIIIYYMFKAYNLVKKKKNESLLVQRKQQLYKQSAFVNKLSFFTNKVSTKKVTKFLNFLELKDKLFAEVEKLLAELEPYRRTRRIKNAKGRSFWYHLERLYKDPQDDIQLHWTELIFDIRFFGVYDEEFNDFFYEELISVIEAKEYVLSNIYSYFPDYEIILNIVNTNILDTKYPVNTYLSCTVQELINPFNECGKFKY